MSYEGPTIKDQIVFENMRNLVLLPIAEGVGDDIDRSSSGDDHDQQPD